MRKLGMYTFLGIVSLVGKCVSIQDFHYVCNPLLGSSSRKCKNQKVKGKKKWARLHSSCIVNVVSSTDSATMFKGMQIHMKNISRITKETTKGSAISYSHWWGKLPEYLQ